MSEILNKKRIGYLNNYYDPNCRGCEVKQLIIIPNVGRKYFHFFVCCKQFKLIKITKEYTISATFPQHFIFQEYVFGNVAFLGHPG